MTSKEMVAAEAQRQQSLIAALWSADSKALAIAARSLPCQNQAVAAERGLQAYRANAHAHAARALQAACPTVSALIGEQDFAHLAVEHWLACPPRRGDLAQWGASLGDWLDQHPQLADWPYLGDCARLDWACHVAASAADAHFDAGSLSLLADTDPAHLRLVLKPGVAVVVSAWPIVSIREAHAHPEGSAERDLALAQARDALHDGRAENALVARAAFDVSVTAIDAATARWTNELNPGCSLAEALDAIALDSTEESRDASQPRMPQDRGFDFGAWLAMAITTGWLHQVIGLDTGGDASTDAVPEASPVGSSNDSAFGSTTH
jgi:hypothetical protein